MFDFSSKQEKFRTVIGFILSFVGSVFVFFSCLCLILVIILSKPYIIFTLNSSDYINTASADLANELNHLAIPSGLTDDFFNDKINKPEFERLTKEAINANYSASAFKPDTSPIKNQLITNFNDFAENEMVINLNSENAEALSELADMCTEKYVSFAAPSLLRYLALYSAKLFKYAIGALVACLVLSVFTLLLNAKINKEKSDTKKTFTFFSLSAAGVMCLLPSVILLIGKFINKVNLKPLSALNYLISFVNGALILMLIIGTILLAAAVLRLYLHPKKQ